MGNGERPRRELAAVLCADPVGRGHLLARDEAAAVRHLAECRHRMEDRVGQFGGRVAELPGDRLLAEFSSAADAVACAVEIQRELARHNAELPEGERLRFRIGVGPGDVGLEGPRPDSPARGVAERLAGLAEPGGICVAGGVREEARERPGVAWQDLGARSVEDASGPVRVHRAVLDGPAGEAAPRAPSPSRRGLRVAAALAGAALLALAAWWRATR